jgi:general secretion pathway protein J
MRKRTRARGFTLLEILLASAIFALVAGIAALGLQNISRSYGALSAQRSAREHLGRTLAQLSADLQQASARPAREGAGQSLGALIGSASELALSTQTARVGPSGPRADLQRVRYVLRNAGLQRITRAAIDAAPNSAERSQLILPEVRALEFSYVDFSGQRSPIWPPANSNYALEALPRAVELRLRDARFGELTSIILVSDIAPQRIDPNASGPAP